MTHFNVYIISDTVCPWCYIGLRRLQLAITDHLSKYPGDTFALQWKPFQLNPNAPKGQTIDKIANYEKSFGPEQAQIVMERLRSAAEGTGIQFSFRGVTGNTLDSHRLVEFARQKEAKDQREGICQPSGLRNQQTRVVEELFSAYFEKEQDITSHDVLAAAAGRAGMYENEVIQLLKSNALGEKVQGEAVDARNQEGVNGVPHFTINDTFEIGGAQEPRAYGMLFERLKKREAKVRSSVL
jgi:predicted DsbA family dithiol-disulfide isomerase